MFSFGKRASTSELPSSLRNSALLTAGLQATIRSQYIIAGMTGLGMILGAVLAAWLMVQIPGVWGGLTLAIPSGWAGLALTVLVWVGRAVGVVMGAVVVSAFFRHVTYTVVAKSLIKLKEIPTITAEESAWLDFEIATMAKFLSKSDWLMESTPIQVMGVLVWVVLAIGAVTGTVSYGPEMLLVIAQIIFFSAFFTMGWSLVFRAPTWMQNLDVVHAEKMFKELQPDDEPLKSVLSHAKPYNDFAIWLVGLAIFSVLINGATQALESELREPAQQEVVSSAITGAVAQFESEQERELLSLLDEVAHLPTMP